MKIVKPDYETLCKCSSALVCALKHRDAHTQMHSDRVVSLAEEIGTACQLPKNDTEILKVAACFHDIGKIGIPDDILLKPSKHDADEWEVMKTHSEIGEDIVKRLELEHGSIVARAVRHHHEYFNGAGYPDRLLGEQIPLFARIISISDSYDAMTSTRPYHKAKTHQQTTDILKQEKGVKFDPDILNSFLSIIENSKNRVS